jgi:hypothetical protein
MAIQVTQPNNDSLQALRTGFEKIRKHPQFEPLARMLQQVHDAPEGHTPHEVATVDLRDLASAAGLQSARIVGHRYLTRAEEKNFAVEVRQVGRDARQQLAEVSHGQTVESVKQILDDPGLQQLVARSSFRVLTLRINALGIHALWFRAIENAEADLIVCVAPAPPYLQLWPKTYTRTEFEDAVRNEAQRKLTADPSTYV